MSTIIEITGGPTDSIIQMYSSLVTRYCHIHIDMQKKGLLSTQEFNQTSTCKACARAGQIANLRFSRIANHNFLTLILLNTRLGTKVYGGEKKIVNLRKCNIRRMSLIDIELAEPDLCFKRYYHKSLFPFCAAQAQCTDQDVGVNVRSGKTSDPCTIVNVIKKDGLRFIER